MPTSQKSFGVTTNNLVRFENLSMYSWFITAQNTNVQELYIKTSKDSAVRLSGVNLEEEFYCDKACLLINPTTITIDW